VLPQALRVIVPPLTSQYLNLTKNSSLAVAIGYPDLFLVFDRHRSTTRPGRPSKSIFMMMSVYLIDLARHLGLHELVQRAHRARGAVRATDATDATTAQRPATPSCAAEPSRGATSQRPVSDEPAPVAWVRANLFSGPVNIGLTLISSTCCDQRAGSGHVLTSPTRSVQRHRLATPASPTRSAVRSAPAGPMSTDRFRTSSTAPIRNRSVAANMTLILGIVGIVGILWQWAAPLPAELARRVYFFFVYAGDRVLPALRRPDFGLPQVPTDLWGGVIVTLVVAVGRHRLLAAAGHPARARPTVAPADREASRCSSSSSWRGVPLITVLFMANAMLPLFVPQEWSPDACCAPLVGVALFSAAYMAEVIRGGLQAIPKGQYEGAMALGLNYPDDEPHRPAAGAEARHPRHRQHLHRAVQGHDAGLHRRRSSTSCGIEAASPIRSGRRPP
jgi:ABC-type amino acid transport system permease subunit